MIDAEKLRLEIMQGAEGLSNLQRYINRLHKWLYFIDEEVIHIQVAGLVGEKVSGDPIWLFLIAPPGGAKTENLRGFPNGKDFFHLSDLTSKTFVSGLMIGQGDKRKKIQDLLPQLNGKVLIFKDFTTVLEKSQEERQQIFAQLREIYDGSFSKKLGTMDEVIRYDCRFGLVAGVTPIIDKYYKLMQQLGERYLKVRWNEDIDPVTTKARENESYEIQMRKELQSASIDFYNSLDFSIDPVLDDTKYGETLDNLAKFVATARTPVVIQDYRSDFYFDYIPTPEKPTRLVKQLKKIARCLALVRGRDEANDYDLLTVRRIAKDTVPQDRIAILECINANKSESLYGCSRPSIFKTVKLPQTSIIRILEQLERLDLIEATAVRKNDSYGVNSEFWYYVLNPIVTNALYPLASPVGYSAPKGVAQPPKIEPKSNPVHPINEAENIIPQENRGACSICGSPNVEVFSSSGWICSQCAGVEASKG